MLQPTSGQQVPQNMPMHQCNFTWYHQIHNYPSVYYTSQQSQRMMTINEEEEKKITAKIHGKR